MKKTKAERDKINARAAAWKRPISAWQLEALRCMAKQPLARGRAGWGNDLLPGRYWQSQTIRALAARRLCRLYGGNAGYERFAKITPKGRAELAIHLPVGPVRKRGLAALFKSMKPLGEEFPEIDDPVTTPHAGDNMNDTPTTTSEPVARTLMTLHFELESDGRLTVTSWHLIKEDLRLSGEPASVFRDLGSAIARALLARTESMPFDAALRPAIEVLLDAQASKAKE
jgi:hypothetical protein